MRFWWWWFGSRTSPQPPYLEDFIVVPPIWRMTTVDHVGRFPVVRAIGRVMVVSNALTVERWVVIPAVHRWPVVE